MSALASSNRLLSSEELTKRESPSFLPLPTRKIAFASTPLQRPSQNVGLTRSLTRGPFRRASFTSAFYTMTASRFARRRTETALSDVFSESTDSNDDSMDIPSGHFRPTRTRIPTPALAPASSSPPPRGALPRTSSYTSNLDTFAGDTSTMSQHGMKNTFPSSVSHISLSTMNVYPSNEYVNVRRPQVPAGTGKRPSMPPTSKSFSGISNRIGQPGASDNTSETTEEGTIQTRMDENVMAPKSNITPQRGLLQPIHPPLPRSQTFGTLLACGSGNAYGRASSELDGRPIRERSTNGTLASTSNAPMGLRNSDSAVSLGHMEANMSTASLTTGVWDKCVKGKRSKSKMLESATGIDEKWVVIDGYNAQQISTSMPNAFWLGRFVALSDRYHNEDNFINPPYRSHDEYEELSFPGENPEAERRRVKRAFLTLMTLCVTDEARASLRAFWSEHARKFGGTGPIGFMGPGLPFSKSVGSGLTLESRDKGKEKDGWKGKERELNKKVKSCEELGDLSAEIETGSASKGSMLMNRLRGLKRSFTRSSETEVPT